MATLDTQNRIRQLNSRLSEIDKELLNDSEWKSFLQMASNFGDEPFLQQLLIYIQKPNATYCLDFDGWYAQRKCVVKKGTKSIIVRKKDQNNRWNTYHYFDVSDVKTINARSELPELLAATDKDIETILKNMCDKEGVAYDNSMSASNLLNSVCHNLVIADLNNLENLLKRDNFKISVDLTSFLIKTINYEVGHRLGIDVDNINFEHEMEILKNEKLGLWNYLSCFANSKLKPILNEINKEIHNRKRLEKLTLLKYDKLGKIEPKLQKGDNINEQSDILLEREHTSSRRSISLESLRDRKMGDNEATLVAGELSRENRINGLSGHTQGPSGRSTDESREDGRINNQLDEERDGLVGRDEEQWSVAEVGTDNADDQTSSSRDNSKRDNLRINEENNKVSLNDTFNVAKVALRKENKAVELDSRLFDDIAKHGTNFVDGKFRVYRLMQDKMSKVDKIGILKDEYGIGGWFGRNEPYKISQIETSGKGMTIGWYNDNDELCTYDAKWNEVFDIIKSACDKGTYLCEEEFARYNLEIETNPNAFLVLKHSEKYLGIDNKVRYEQANLFDVAYLNAENNGEEEKPAPSVIYGKYEDAFFVNGENKTVTWMYYNPDSNAGGQYVTNTLNFDEISVAAERCDTSDEFFDYLGSIANQTLADVGTEWFAEAENQFLQQPDFIECTEETMQKLIEISQGDEIEEEKEDAEIESLYGIGDKVNIDDIIFTITEIRDNSVQLLDKSLVYPVFRVESKELIDKLVHEQNKNILEFNSSEFEKHIPDNMRYKEVSSVAGNLYWITQGVFDSKDLTEFQNALKDTGFEKAYVTVRDISSYEFEDDLKRNVLAIVTNDSIEAKSYYQAIKDEFGVDLNTEEENIENTTIAEKNTAKSEKTSDFVITDKDLGVGTPRERYANNIAAIKTLKKIEDENRYATKAEQEILSKYVGWGGLADAFDENKWANEYKELKELLNDEEYRNASRSTLTSFYTQPVVIESMYKTLENFGFNKGNILEPAMGIGNFFGSMPQNMSNNSNKYGIELDSISGRIAKQLYQKANIQVKGYEKTSLPNNFFDVAVGNVPFGDFSVNDSEYNKYNFNIHDYFFAKTIDKVRTGGVIAFITSKYTMDKKSENVRKYIAERCDLVGAIRLPNTAFKGAAGTTVTSDILFLQKRETPAAIMPSWVKVEPIIKEEYRHLSKEENKAWIKETLLHGTGEDFDDKLANNVGHYTPYYLRRIFYQQETLPYWKQREIETEKKQLNEVKDGDHLKYLYLNSKYESVRKKAEEKIDEIVEELFEANCLEKGEDFEINSYFNEHPEMVLGDMKLVTSRFGFDLDCLPKEGITLEEELDKAISNLKTYIPQVTAIESEEVEHNENVVPASADIDNYSFGIIDNVIYYRTDSVMEKVQDKEANLNNLRQQIAIRDKTVELLNLQVNDFDDEAIEKAQKELNDLYDSYAKKYGLLSKPNNQKIFDKDSKSALVASLETLNEDGDFVGKSDVFYKRTIAPSKPLDHVDTSFEALSISLGEKGVVDLDYMQKLTDKEIHTITDDLKGIIFHDPVLNEWVAADEYLSGNVRNKLEIAKMKAESDPNYQINVESLEKIQPKWIGAEDIAVQIGNTWIPEEYYEKFIEQVFDYKKWNSPEVNYSKYTGEWQITNKSSGNYDVNLTSKYGTSRLNGLEILERTLNLRDANVYDYVEDDGKKKAVLNDKETLLATQKQDEIKLAFKDWIFNDIDRREILEKIYNEKFNSVRPREYDGSHLKFPGMASDITLLEHQLNAVARCIYGGNSLLAHVVGAGKTYTMVASAMESKRLGLCTKTLIVVPNHLVGQWGSEFLRLYPNANILVATKKDFETKNRKKFCGRIATGDYDAVIIGQSQFERIPLSMERQQAMLQNQIDEIVYAVADLKEKRSENFTVKRMEAMKQKLEKKLENLQNQEIKDDVINFEQLGIDRLYIDEAHYYKNLFMYSKMTRVAGVQSTEANRSSDLFNKVTYLDEITGGKGVVFATGTPISNSMVELYTMQRYLQRYKLNDMDLNLFDTWASTFGETVTALELKPEGTGYQTKKRFAKFNNLPELMTVFKEVADIQTADTLKLPVPNSEYHDVVLEPSEEQKAYIKSLADRAEAVRDGRVDPSEDNMLKVTNDGRKVALDQRLVDESYEDNENSKVNALVENIVKLYQDYDEYKAAQLVFCDLSTPAQGKGSVYHDIKNKLVDRGIPDDEIQFIQDHKKDNEKKALFGKVRAGSVRVLIGSTNTMGAGTNVQDRLIALHHLDVPWKPSDIEQQEGRILRQGNMFRDLDKPVHIYRYITKGTFDAYSWQIIENKQKFIGQIMTSKSPVRSAEDVDESALSYAEIKALATGNPLIKEKMDLDIEVSKLKLLKASYQSNLYKLQDSVARRYPEQIASYKTFLTKVNEDIKTLESNELGTSLNEANEEVKNFKIELNNMKYSDKKEAGAIVGSIKDSTNSINQKRVFGNYRGLNLFFDVDNLPGYKTFFAKGKLNYVILSSGSGTGLLTNLENIDKIILSRKQEIEMKLNETITQLDKAKVEVNQPFAYEQELHDKILRLNELNELLSKSDKKDNNTKEIGEYEKLYEEENNRSLEDCIDEIDETIENFNNDILNDNNHIKDKSDENELVEN